MTTVSDKIKNAKDIIAAGFIKKRERDFKILLSIFEKNGITEDELLDVITPILKEEKFCDMSHVRDSVGFYEIPEFHPTIFDRDRYSKDYLYPEQIEEFNKAKDELGKYIAYDFKAMQGLEEYIKDKSSILSSSQKPTVSFDEHTSTLMLDAKRIKFITELRKKIIKKLWQERMRLDRETKKTKHGGTLLTQGELAAHVNFILSPLEFKKYQDKKEEFLQNLKGMGRQIKKLGEDSVVLKNSGGVQLIVYE